MKLKNFASLLFWIFKIMNGQRLHQNGWQHHGRDKGWLPVSLRRPTLLAFIAFLLLNILSLELVKRAIDRMDMISADNKVAVNALKYVPTVITILIGFAWKGIASDYCLLQPWSTISGHWARVEDSILLNYVDSLDVVNVYVAVRHRHWMLAMVVACGLLSGVSVPLANSLPEAMIDVGRTTNVKLAKVDDFDINKIVQSPLNWQNPLAIYNWQRWVSVRREMSSEPWSSSSRAFPALDIAHYTGQKIVTGRMDTFSANLSCTTLSYQGTYLSAQPNATFVLHANSSQCRLPISQQVQWPHNSTTVSRFAIDNSTGTLDIPPISWSNVSDCNEDGDLRLLVTNIVLTIFPDAVSDNTTNIPPVWDSDTIAVNASGVICEPIYQMTPTDFATDVSTGLVDPYSVVHQDESRPIQDLSVGLDFMHAQTLSVMSTSIRLCGAVDPS